ncbi:MAG: response regulator [Burkholderiaceae bacterium]|nr:response regulator [Burkholderiaceae bacterium]
MDTAAALVGEPVVLIDIRAGRVVHVNAEFSARTGFPVDAVVGRTPGAGGWWTEPDGPRELLDALPDAAAAHEARLALRHRDGRAVSIGVRAARVGPAGSHLQIVGQTDADSVEREALFRHVPVGLAMSRSRRFVQVNPAFERLFGWSAGELVGQPGRAVWPSDEVYAEIGRRVGPALLRGEVVDLEPVEVVTRDGTARVLRMVVLAIDARLGIGGGTLWICEDVGERIRLGREMVVARRRAEAASQAKSQFLANMSHELRTPLNAILGLARLLQQDGAMPPDQARHVGLIADSASGLAAVVSDILDLCKIEAGHVTLESAPFELHELVNSLHASFQVLATSRDLAFVLEIAPAVPRIVAGDAHRVRQILANLVNNALKFTAVGGVRVALTPAQAGCVRFEVHDTGPGFDDAERERLFQPFTQADDSTTRRYGGTGLGLSICRELAELMGGRVGAVGRPGSGSEFWFELPLAASTDVPVASDFAQLDEQALVGIRVLVVEDNPVNLLICVALLERRGAQVRQAGDGHAAIEAAQAAAARGEPFDVVLMDLQMPVLGGLEATRRLREQWTAADLAVIGLSAAAFASERAEALAAGMDDFVAKPVEPRRLERAIVRALRRRRHGGG